jgi:hypothetical protein
MKTSLTFAIVTLSAATLLLASAAGAGAGGFVIDAGAWRYVAGHNGGYWTYNPHFQQPVSRHCVIPNACGYYAYGYWRGCRSRSASAADRPTCSATPAAS